MPSAETRQKNPFIGPRSFKEGEQLYGRKRETIQLTNLLIAERIILLYSPSGAGKTSLIHAALLPKLRQRHFVTLPIMRVNLEPPSEFIGQPGFNRYTFSLLTALEADRPNEMQKPEAELAQLSLVEYLDQRRADSEDSIEQAATLLVFDQFEEILTIDASDLALKQAFFEQLGTALKDPNLWALFSMREDYIAGLDPYLLAIPTHLRNTFRLDLLSRDTARHVLQRTALQAEVNFTDEAADRLIDDLSRVRLQKLDGSIEDRPGISVEPVQLQVVCYNLWERLPPEVEQITLSEIEALGDVDQALGDYYGTQVAAVAQHLQVSERNLRRWFDEALITPSGIRNQVLLEQSTRQGINNEAIYRLEDVHLVRLETVRNRTWVELAHDRLVAPVRQNNAAWFEEHLSVLQRQTSRWLAENRAEHLLLRGDSLVQAQDWVGEHAEELLPEESEFLAASQDAQEKERAEQQLAEAARRSKSQRRFIIFITLALLAAVVFGINSALQTVRANSQANLERTARADANTQATAAHYAQVTSGVLLQTAEAGSTVQAEQALAARATGQYAEIQKATAEAASTLAVANAAEARTQADLAFSRQLAAQGNSLLASQPELAANLAAESYALAPAWENKSLLLEIVQRQEQQSVQPFGPPLPEESGALNTISAFAISPDGKRLAWGTLAGDVTIWNYQEHNYEPGWDSVRLHSGNVLSLAFSPDGALLASGGIRERQLYITNLETRERIASLEPINQTRALAFHPELPLLAVAVLNRVSLWDTNTWQPIEFPFTGDSDWINDLTWSPDGTLLAFSLSAAGARTKQGVGLWSLETYGVLKFFERDTQFHQVSWSPDGSLLAAAGQDGAVRFWDIPELTVSTRAAVPQLEQAVYAAAFSPDGKTFVRGGADVGFTVFSTQDYQIIDRIQSPLNGWIRYLDYFPKAGFNLLAAVNENQANLRYAVSLYEVNPTPPLGTEFLAKSSGTEADAHAGPVISTAFSPDGKLVVSIGCDAYDTQLRCTRGTARAWDAVTRQEADFIGLGSEVVSIAFSPDGSRLASGNGDGTIQVWDLATEQEISVMDHGSPVLSIAFSPDGRWVVSGARDGTVRVWDIALKREISQIDHGFSVSSVAFSPLGQQVVSGSSDGQVLLWDPANGQEIYRAPHGKDTFSVAFSPDGLWVVSGGCDRSYTTLPVDCLEGRARVFQAETGEGVASLLHNLTAVLSVAFSPDGSMLATGSADGRLNLWDTTGFQQIGSSLNQGRRGVSSLAFSPDGRVLVAGYQDHSLWAWNVNADAWMDTACETAGRSLDGLEQAQYFRNGGYQDICANR